MQSRKVAWGIPTENGVVKKAKEGDEGSLQFVAKMNPSPPRRKGSSAEGGVRQLAKRTLHWQESLDTSEHDKVSAGLL